MARKALKLVNKLAPKISKPRLTNEQRAEIFHRLTVGKETALSLSAEYGVSNATIGSVKKSFSGGGASDMPAPKESPLRQAIYLYGYRVLTGEAIPPEEEADLKAQIEAKQRERMRQFASEPRETFFCPNCQSQKKYFRLKVAT
jgi:hypothetical protein